MNILFFQCEYDKGENHEPLCYTQENPDDGYVVTSCCDWCWSASENQKFTPLCNTCKTTVTNDENNTMDLCIEHYNQYIKMRENEIEAKLNG